MSVFYLAAWSTNERLVPELDGALRELARHVVAEHPALQSLRTWQQWWGPLPRRGHYWMEEFTTLEVMAGERHDLCDALWSRVHELAEPTSFHSSVLTAPLVDVWKNGAP